MTAPKPARIFISYATKDGADAASKLRRDLETHGFSIWEDIVALQGDADWWSQIENALRSKELQHFTPVVTPGALASHTADIDYCVPPRRYCAPISDLFNRLALAKLCGV